MKSKLVEIDKKTQFMLPEADELRCLDGWRLE